mmetsp:Transcript_2069/g.3213  ORF Transcript_2069/g.3213 Transcript_2069/m.3213 type:complete len:217 (-) Transcript_2069:112-762(-)
MNRIGFARRPGKATPATLFSFTEICPHPSACPQPSGTPRATSRAAGWGLSCRACTWPRSTCPTRGTSSPGWATESGHGTRACAAISDSWTRKSPWWCWATSMCAIWMQTSTTLRTHAQKKQSATTPEERSSFSELLDAGFIDTFRWKHPEASGAYSYWSQRARNRPYNRGLRIDYALVSQRLENRIIDAFILHEETEGRNDHCPVALVLKQDQSPW